MKIVFFYVLFLISLIVLAGGLGLAFGNDFNDEDFSFGLIFISFGIFILFILWKNNFFTKSK